jgi:hypothetical protein
MKVKNPKHISSRGLSKKEHSDGRPHVQGHSSQWPGQSKATKRSPMTKQTNVSDNGGCPGCCY